MEGRGFLIKEGGILRQQQTLDWVQDNGGGTCETKETQRYLERRRYGCMHFCYREMSLKRELAGAMAKTCKSKNDNLALLLL
jgi:hypothetical protein